MSLTTIGITRTTKQRLLHLKRYRLETYDEIVNRLIDAFKVTKDGNSKRTDDN